MSWGQCPCPEPTIPHSHPVPPSWCKRGTLPLNGVSFVNNFSAMLLWIPMTRLTRRGQTLTDVQPSQGIDPVHPSSRASIISNPWSKTISVQGGKDSFSREPWSWCFPHLHPGQTGTKSGKFQSKLSPSQHYIGLNLTNNFRCTFCAESISSEQLIQPWLFLWNAAQAEKRNKTKLKGFFSNFPKIRHSWTVF